VAPSKSNLERPVGTFDVDPVAPAVVPNAAAAAPTVDHVAPTVAAAQDLVFMPIDEDSVP